MKISFLNVAGPLEESSNMLKTSFVLAPTVITSGKFPGKLIVPYEGPSLPADTMMTILA
jgi:hypothetical protein